MRFFLISHLSVFLTIVGVTIPSNGWAEESGKKKILADLTELPLESLMDIEVTTVSRRASTVGQSPAAVFVITPEMIRRSGATTIPELFRMVPGVDVARIDNNKWAVSARGFNERFGRFMLVQIDGRVLYSPVFSGVYWDTVDYPLEDIERIEVIRGSGASVWGANAVNGIINIITKRALETQGGLVSGGGGTEERGFGTARYGGKIKDNLAYRVYGKGFNRDKQFSTGVDPNDRWWGANTGLRSDWQVNEDNAVTFDGGYLHSTAGRRDSRPQTTNPFSFLNIEDEVTDAGHLLGYWTHTVDKDSNLKLQLYWDHSERVFENLGIHIRRDTVDLDFQHELPLGHRQKIIYGSDYRYIDNFMGSSANDSGFVTSLARPNRYLQFVSIFVHDQIALVEERLSLGIELFERREQGRKINQLLQLTISMIAGDQFFQQLIVKFYLLVFVCKHGPMPITNQITFRLFIRNLTSLATGPSSAAIEAAYAMKWVGQSDFHFLMDALLQTVKILYKLI